MTIQTVRKNYHFGDQLVATRPGDEVYFIHGDHPSTVLRAGLGSTSLTTDISGTVVAETRYLPYGEERWTAGGAQPTDFTFTGQRAERGFGLMDYKARYYDPRLGRFISADTVVPAYTNPQDLNRYSYAMNSPLKYTDPSGHCVWGLCIVEGAIIGAGLLLAVDYGIQVNQNLKAGMSFWDAVYHENVDTQELGGAMFLGASGGATTAVVAPAAAPYAYYYADKAYGLSRTPGGKVAGNALEGAAEGCLEGSCSPESVAAGAVEGVLYAVAFEVELPTGAYPGRSRKHHNQIANRALLEVMDADPAFESAMNDLIPGIREQLVGPRGGISRESPPNWTWHHDQREGNMQLVPRSQHEALEFQDLFHPGGEGGFAIWGR